MFAHHDVGSAFDQAGHVEPARVGPIGEKQVVFPDDRVDFPKEADLVPQLAAILPHRGFQDDSRGEREKHHQAHDGETAARRLASLPRILRLVFRSVGHRDRDPRGDAVDQVCVDFVFPRESGSTARRAVSGVRAGLALRRLRKK